MADKKSKNNKKPAAKTKPQATAKKTTAPKTPAKKPVKATAKPKTVKRTEPKPPAKVMKELEELAKKHKMSAIPAAPATAPRVNVSKSGETKVAPPTGNIKEITVKYRF